ncbi:hypothetical protein SAMN06265365_10969 [Tistlia consotensis]|uniref:Sel1 repeat-containing protein n=1 Tax=Tistlia consotensis USBA 355 TaxID=560819 RepID=A0A1Y6CLN4_9PROT|nr:sel1 repeat family protein [Tistlia consotensis]SMF58323.1 hypothetical protein SAMN05428998_12220 [Tistlia consotensis USBA 355]SNR63265.1 hypothetical protein SAMN06265365_10969 [Tistlia consotensis]
MTLTGIYRLGCCLLLLALGGCVGAAMEGANITKDKVVYEKHIDAARAGKAEAEFEVGQALCCSIGDRQGFYDTRAATDWLCKAAGQGYAPASQKLGQIYSGNVVQGVRLMRRIAEKISDRPTNLPLSYTWLKVAEGQGSSDAAEDAKELWSGLNELQRTKARALMQSPKPLPCRWDEVFPQ